VQLTIAVALARRAMRFADLAWEDLMLADLLCDRADAAALVTAVGGDQATGWRKISSGLSRQSRSRVLAAHPNLG
jgi:hypothetical protein